MRGLSRLQLRLGEGEPGHWKRSGSLSGPLAIRLLAGFPLLSRSRPRLCKLRQFRSLIDSSQARQTVRWRRFRGFEFAPENGAKSPLVRAASCLRLGALCHPFSVAASACAACHACSCGWAKGSLTTAGRPAWRRRADGVQAHTVQAKRVQAAAGHGWQAGALARGAQPAAQGRDGSKRGANSKPPKRPHRTVFRAWALSNKERIDGDGKAQACFLSGWHEAARVGQTRPWSSWRLAWLAQPKRMPSH